MDEKSLDQELPRLQTRRAKENRLALWLGAPTLLLYLPGLVIWILERDEPEPSVLRIVLRWALLLSLPFFVAGIAFAARAKGRSTAYAALFVLTLLVVRVLAGIASRPDALPIWRMIAGWSGFLPIAFLVGFCFLGDFVGQRIDAIQRMRRVRRAGADGE